MGKVYDFTLTVGADDSAANQVLALLEKNLAKATKKENVISITADATNVEKALKELVELNPTVGANIELKVDQSAINKEIDFLNGILNSKTELDADKVVSKLKSAFTSGIKNAKLGEILSDEVGDSSKSIANVQKAVDSIVSRITNIDITDSMDMSEMTSYIKDLETASVLINEISKNKKLTKVDLTGLTSVVDSNKLKSAYSQIGQNVLMNSEQLLQNLQQKSLSVVQDFQKRLKDILQYGAGYEIVASDELEKEKAKLAEMEQALARTSQSADQLENRMISVANSIEKYEDAGNDSKVRELQQELLQLAEIYKSNEGIDLFDDEALDDESLDYLKTAIYAVLDAKDELKDFHFQIVSEEDVEKQRALVQGMESLQDNVASVQKEMDNTPLIDEQSSARIKELEKEVENLREDLASAQLEARQLGEDLSTAQAELYEATYNQRTVEDFDNADKVKELEKQVDYLSEKLREAQGTINEFANELTTAERKLESALEQQQISINIEPAVEPAEFASKLTGQLTVPAQIEVEGKVSDPQKFAWDIAGAIDYIPLDVTFNPISDDSYQELKKELDLVIPSLALEIPVELSAQETAEQTQLAADVIEEEGNSAKEAAVAKEKFVEANKAVAIASEKTAEKTKEAAFGINDELNAAKDKGNALKKFRDEMKATDGVITGMVNTLDDDKFSFERAINYAQRQRNNVKYNASTKKYEIDSSLISDYKKLGNAIAESDAKMIKLYATAEKLEAQGTDNVPTLELLDAEYDKSIELRRVWAEMRNDPAQLLGQDEDNWLNTLRSETQMQAQLNIEQQEAIEIFKAQNAAMAENEKHDSIRHKVLQEEQKIRRALGEEVKKQRQAAAQASAREDAAKENSALVAQEKAYRNIISVRAQIDALKLKSGDHSSELQNLQDQLTIQQKLYGQATLQIKAVNSEYNAYERLKEIREATAADAAKAAQKVAVAEDSANRAAKDKADKDAADAKKKADKTTALSDQNKQAAKAYKDLTRQAKTYYKLLGKEAAGTLTSTESAALENLKKEWSDASDGVGKYSIALADITDSSKTATAAANNFFNSSNDSALKASTQLSGYAERLEELKADPSRYTGVDIKNIEALLDRINAINAKPIDLNSEQARKDISQLNKDVDAFFNNLDKAAKDISIGNIKNEISDYLNKNTNLSMKFRIELYKLSQELESGLSDDRLKEIYQRFTDIRIEARQFGQDGARSLDTISQRLSDMDSKFIAQLLSWQDIIRYIRTVAETVKELDTALTEMRKVSNESVESLRAYQGISFDLADDIGSTGLQIQNSTADFMRLGETLEEAQKSASTANILMNVSEFESISEATDSLIAMSAAYSDLEKIDIVNKLNKIGNEYAVSTDGIATALQSSASALVTAHNDIDEAIALVTAGNLVTQDPNKVGTGLRTISLRLTGTKAAAAELAEMGEEVDTMITTESKLRQTILDATKVDSNNNKGFDILDENGNYKSTYQIMLGLSEIYDEIAAKDKQLGQNNLNLLLETIAGKNRANIAASILQNPDTLASAFDDSKLNSANSALEENQKFLESIEGHLQRLQNAVQDLFHSLIDSGLINDVLDFAIKFVEALDAIVEALGSKGSLVAAGGLVLLLRNLGPITGNLIKNLPDIITAIGMLTDGTGSFLGVLEALFPQLSTIGGALAPFAPYLLAIAGALAAIGVGVWVFDKLTISVQESQKRIDEYNKSIETLTTELEQLRSLDNKTSYDNKRIATLEKELEVQKKLLEIEQQRYYQNLTESSVANSFDSDNIATQQSRDVDHYQNRNSTAATIRDVEQYVDRLGVINDELNTLYSELDTASSDKERQKITKKISKLDAEKKKIEPGQRYSDLLDKYQIYIEQEEQLTEALNAKTSSGFDMLTGKARDDALKELDFAREKINAITETVRAFEIETERFDPFNAITGIASEKIFNEEEIIKAISSTGDLEGAQSRLMAQFPSLIGLCSKYGITLEELVAHYWEEKEAIEAVQEAEAKSVNTLSTAVSNMNSRILPQFDALEKVYDEIFNGDKGFNLSEIGTDDLEGIRAAFQDLDEDLSIDWAGKTEDVDKFLSVIGNSSSTVSEVHDAFDALATSYFNAAVASGDFTEENAKVLEQMLTEMGVVNSKEVVDYYVSVANAEERAAEAGVDFSNVTASQLAALNKLGVITAEDAKMFALLAVQEQIANGQALNTEASVQSLMRLAQTAGFTAAEIDVLNQVMRMFSQADAAEAAGGYQAATAITTEANNLLMNFQNEVQKRLNQYVDIDFASPKVAESAGSGGKDAADSYIEAFENELKSLEEQRDAGLISEKEFLDKYKALIEKYFKDVDGYGEEYAKRMGDYFQRAISYYESIFSAVGTLLDHRINAAQEGKDAAVDALNAEKEAALAAYDAQLDAIDALIEAKQDEIDAVQDEIDKLREEREERQRNIDLQRAQYELQRAQNQRTRLIYQDGQMVYDTDTDAIREAKEQVDDAEFEIAVAALEKQKSLLEDQLEALQGQREAIEKAREAAEEYYDKLIEDTEKYWDSIIDALEKQKSKWEELAEIKEIANAYALVQEAGESLGYSVEDILNDVPGAFEAFRDAYIGILQDANSENSNFLDGLAYATGAAKDSVNSALGEIAGKASEVDKALEPLGEISTKVGDTATALGNIATNSGTAASNVSTLSSNLDSAAGSAEGISKIDDSVKSISGAQLDGTVQAFQNLAGALKDCADALGIGDGELSAFESAIDALSQVTLGDESTGAIGAFNALATAIGAVTTAIGAAGEAGETAESGSESEEGSGGNGGLIGAIEDVKEAADQNIGTTSSAGAEGGEGGEGGDTEGGETAISDFDALYAAVGNVIKVIGNPEDDYAEGGGEDGGTLVNAIKGLPIVGEESIRGDSGIIAMFTELLEIISQCAAKASELLESIRDLGEAGGAGLLGHEYTGNVHVNAHKDGNVHGNAYASGRLGLKKSENALVGELGQELVYNPETGTYRTVGDHGPEITHLNKGDLIFNAEQTKAIIKHGKHGGNSYANGSGLMPLSDAEMNMFKTMGNALVGIKADTSQMLEPVRTIAQNISKVTTNNISPTINISGTSFNVSGVTGEAVAAQIRDTFTGLVASAYQRAMT